LDVIRDTVELFYPGTFDAKTGEMLVETKQFDKYGRTAKVSTVGDMVLTGRGLVGGDMDGMQGTAYGWLNAVTQYVDHHARAMSDENRFQSAHMGKGSELKLRAREMAMRHADGRTVLYAEESAPHDPHHGSVSLDDVLAATLAA
jgi:hypothetical protein